jgi:hypothetical protein
VSWLLTLWPDAAPGCRGCAHFHTDPVLVEAAFPGLSSLSSAHASVRGGDGLCGRNGRMTNGRARCERFAPA